MFLHKPNQAVITYILQSAICDQYYCDCIDNSENKSIYFNIKVIMKNIHSLNLSLSVSKVFGIKMIKFNWNPWLKYIWIEASKFWTQTLLSIEAEFKVIP